MKKSLVIIAIAFSIISCNKKAEVASTKTAYVDTSKLMMESTEAKDIEAKYKAKSQEMGKELEIEIAKFKAEAGSFQKNAQMNGQAWAQQKGAELQKREQQLQYAQQSIAQQLQQESGLSWQQMSNRIAALQINAWASEQFDESCKLESFSIMQAIAHEFAKRDVIFVVCRRYKQWSEILGKSDMYRLNSYRRAYISKKNLDKCPNAYDEILKKLTD